MQMCLISFQMCGLFSWCSCKVSCPIMQKYSFGLCHLCIVFWKMLFGSLSEIMRESHSASSVIARLFIISSVGAISISCWHQWAQEPQVVSTFHRSSSPSSVMQGYLKLLLYYTCAEDIPHAHLPLTHPFPWSLPALASPRLMAVPALR